MVPGIVPNLAQDIKELIASVTGLDAAQLTPEAKFWEDLGVDSIKAIEITVAMEKKFKIRVKDEQVAQITTVAKAVEIVQEALNNKKT